MSKLILDEMNGPDELRKLTVETQPHQAARIHAIADAWEAQTEEDTNIILDTSTQAIELMATIDALRKRLEAANRLLDRCMGYLEGDDELRKAVYAALAGEEKP